MKPSEARVFVEEQKIYRRHIKLYVTAPGLLNCNSMPLNTPNKVSESVGDVFSIFFVRLLHWYWLRPF
jgi:hypothetical protein